MNTLFEPTDAAARARLAAVQPAAYARSRNAIEGAVTHLSPYLTHGFLSLPEVLADVAARHPLEVTHKWVLELGWREYFHHVWQHQGEGIWASLHPGPLPDEVYAHELPADIRQARTGVPAIDTAVRTLYATGYLHNHARMWLASYLVHLRKLHWRTGADWLYAHLLDGDLASNSLSWQWVAGTGSHKPYLFNADNVARYAPPAWHSPGSVIDTSYAALEAWAHTPGAVPTQAVAPGVCGVHEPSLHHEPPDTRGLSLPDAALVAGRDVWLVHPWALHAPPAGLPPNTLCLGVYLAEFHQCWAWSAARWAFVGTRMAALSQACWFINSRELALLLAGARSVLSQADPHIDALPSLAQCQPPARLFADVARPCPSFSQWWRRTAHGLASLQALPGLAAHWAQGSAHSSTPPSAGPLFDPPPAPEESPP